MGAFRLQIIDGDGQVVQLPAGGTLEADLYTELTSELVAQGAIGLLDQSAVYDRLIADIKAAFAAKGVGVFRTEAHVLLVAEQAVRESLDAVQRDVADELRPMILSALKIVFQRLKRKTVAVA